MPEWTSDICATLRGLDAHHLIIDGHDGIVPASLDDDNVDLVSVHYYPGRGYDFPQKLQDDVEVSAPRASQGTGSSPLALSS